LLGFPGSGKTTIAKKLANRLQYQCIDLDLQFEKTYQMSIPDFFKKYGEEVFRKSEHLILKEILHKDHIVISTGGGTPCFHGNMELILENSYSVYLKMSPVSLHHRLVNSKRIRPLVQNKTPEEIKQFIDTMLLVREQYYLQADFVIKGENFDIEQLYQCLK